MMTFNLPPKDLPTWRRLYWIILQYRGVLAFGILLTIPRAVIGGGSFPVLAERIINMVENKDRSGLFFWCGLAAPIFLVRAALIYLQMWHVARPTQRIIADMRQTLFGKFLALSLGFFHKRRTGELISRVTNDLALMQNFIVMSCQDLLQIPLQILVGIGLCLYYSWQLTLFGVATVPLLAYLINRTGKRMRKVTGGVQGKLADLASIVQESIVAIPVIKAFTSEKLELQRFRRENEETLRMTLRGMRIRAFLQPLVELIGAAGALCGLCYGGYLVITTDTMAISRLVGFLFGVNLIFNNLNKIPNITLGAQESLAAAERLFDVLDSEDRIHEKPDAAEMKDVRGKVEFDRVSFGYEPDRPVLKNISLTVESGSVTALVGATGSGKTTFVNLIPRFFDVNSGAVRIDGTDVRDVTLESLRKQTGIVPQDTILFGATIRQNIAYGSEHYAESDLMNAARAANAHEFIAKLPKGYETPVGERGVTLSGGQKQRIAIARAILRNPRILILDEATSSVDNQSEALIQAALDRLMKGRTTFVIAHRLSTVLHADRILVLEEGEIVEEGSHQTLYDLGGAYRRLYDRAVTEKPRTQPDLVKESDLEKGGSVA